MFFVRFDQLSIIKVVSFLISARYFCCFMNVHEQYEQYNTSVATVNRRITIMQESDQRYRRLWWFQILRQRTFGIVKPLSSWNNHQYACKDTEPSGEIYCVPAESIRNTNQQWNDAGDTITVISTVVDIGREAASSSTAARNTYHQAAQRSDNGELRLGAVSSVFGEWSPNDTIGYGSGTAEILWKAPHFGNGDGNRKYKFLIWASQFGIRTTIRQADDRMVKLVS